MLIVVQKTFSIFLIAGIGFIANRIGILPKESNKYLVDLLMLITCPCMIISGITSKTLTEDLFGTTVTMFVGSILFFMVFSFVAWLVCVRLLGITPERGAGVLMVSFTTVNVGFIGFPVTYAIFGNDILYLMVLFQAVLITYVYSFGVIQINYGTKKATEWKTTAKSAMNVCTISAIVSLIMLVMGLHLPGPIFESVQTIGSTTVPLSMIVVGMQLGGSDYNRVFHNRDLLILSFIKMLSLPIITFLLVNWMPIHPDVKLGLVFGAAFPAAVVIVPISAIEGRDSILAAECVALTTLISLATLPLTAMLLTSYYLT